MTAFTGAELDELLALRRQLGRQADDVDDAARDADHALDRFHARSTEFVPALPAHGHRGAALASRLDALGFRVERTHAALAAADRWVGATVGLAVLEADGVRGGAQDVATTARAGWEWIRHGEVQLAPPAGRAAQLSRPSTWFVGQYDEVTAAIRHLRGVGPSPVVPTSTGGRLGQALARFQGTRAASAVRLGGTALAVAGIAAGTYDVYAGMKAGDTERAVTGGLGAVAGVAMLSGIPPVQLAGAALSAGLFIYEYHDEIGEFLSDPVGSVGDMASAAKNFFGGLF